MDIIKSLLTALVGLTAVAVGFVGVLIFMALIWAIPTYFLWNWLMPDLFNLGVITIWQAIGINILSGILFKSTNKTK